MLRASIFASMSNRLRKRQAKPENAVEPDQRQELVYTHQVWWTPGETINHVRSPPLAVHKYLYSHERRFFRFPPCLVAAAFSGRSSECPIHPPPCICPAQAAARCYRVVSETGLAGAPASWVDPRRSARGLKSLPLASGVVNGGEAISMSTKTHAITGLPLGSDSSSPATGRNNTTGLPQG
ncbi:hypothetical protein N658DRAFT_255516 [Parathielavia hyrcaniae]|uniref:Uncharacterized protein n=1 Tax=Parathielavia hyrcaniae TaxID=113614 RepID=A0AAN6SYZ9_9PEZI|nr:hypothetical protein N658DRAFT_255516 [Parathielavia hyrcaniae]